MDSTTLPRGGSGALGGLPHRDRTVAGPGFSRWMVPPAALCVHLCIGQAYAFNVFNLPMRRLIGITKSAPDDWKLTELGCGTKPGRPRCSPLSALSPPEWKSLVNDDVRVTYP
jgi:hypothetical protein